MNGQQLLKELKGKLLRKGMAPEYVNRLIQELSEHQEDLKSREFAEHQDPRIADMMAARRLGGVDELADTICGRMRERTFIGRHPWVSYVLLPILAFAVSMAVVGLGLSAVEWLRTLWTGEVDTDAPRWAYRVLLVLSFFLKYGLTALIAYMVCRAAMWTFCGIRWAAIGIMVFAVFTLFVSIHVLPPDESFPKRVQFQLGIAMPVDPVDHMPSFSGAGCFLKERLLNIQGPWHYVPFLILGGYYLQIRRRAARSDLASE